MAFWLGLLGLVAAGDIIELEPVKVSATNHWGCSQWNDQSNQSRCVQSPYCRWYGNNGEYKCYDDPCLKLMKAGETCTSVTIDSNNIGETVMCTTITTLSSKFQNGDCLDTATPLDLCAQTVTPPKNNNLYTYCVYAQLRDGKCPDSVCREFDPSASDNKIAGQCLPNNKENCGKLSTSDECGLVPKCYWKNSNCITDPCYKKESDTGAGLCANYHPSAGITCKEFKPLIKNGGGNVDTYCVISDNKNPNICYLGNPGTDPASDTDYNKTYPTTRFNTANYNLAATPQCSTTGITDCDNMGNCTLVINTKGGFAGAYCSDGTHGAGNILRVPSLVVVLLIALVALFNF